MAIANVLIQPYMNKLHMHASSHATMQEPTRTWWELLGLEPPPTEPTKPPKQPPVRCFKKSSAGKRSSANTRASARMEVENEDTTPVTCSLCFMADDRDCVEEMLQTILQAKDALCDVDGHSNDIVATEQKRELIQVEKCTAFACI